MLQGEMQMFLITPYVEEYINRNKNYYKSMYDGIAIPAELIGTHPKTAIKKEK